MSKLLKDVAYCHKMAERYYSAGDYVGGEIYTSEIIYLTESAEAKGIITEAQGNSLRRFGKI